MGDHTEQFPGLPFTQPEVEAIAQLIPNSQVLLNRELSRAALMAQLKNYNVLHLAANARIVPGKSEESFIVLGDGDRLTLKELQTWNLSHVDLMVLSGCNTATTEGQDGVEVLSFTSALQRAGAKSVMGSLWTVDDQVTQKLMDQFYRSWASGTMTKTEALQQAQLAMIRSEPTSNKQKAELHLRPVFQAEKHIGHPFYWARFILAGNGL